MKCVDGTFLSSKLRPHFELTICNVDSIDKTKKYYTIECRTMRREYIQVFLKYHKK